MAAHAAEKLPALNANISKTTVSGLSSGAYMAGQFHIVHSNDVIGAAIIAGGPFGCAESWQSKVFWFWPGVSAYNGLQATEGCMKINYWAAGIPSPRALQTRAETLAEKEEIDPLKNLSNDHVYLFAGGEDTVVNPKIVKSAAELYVLLGVPEKNIFFDENKKAGHTFLTEDTGNSCSISEKPYIADCDYDQAGVILKQFFQGLAPKKEPHTGRFIIFDQQEFTSNLWSHGMAEEGAAFIPETCENSSNCRVHIVFHGCNQSREEIGDLLIKEAGFPEWASSNNLILLFPQIKKNKRKNPFGCWDWWGYTGSNFTTKSAPQIEAVWRMLKRVTNDTDAN